MQPIYKKTKKFYYTFNESKEIERGKIYDLMDGFYKDGDSLDKVIYKPSGDNNSRQDWEYFYPSNFSDLQAHFLGDKRYYLKIDLLP